MSEREGSREVAREQGSEGARERDGARGRGSEAAREGRSEQASVREE